jgi:DNA-binding transcriptional MocR family regulator
MLIPIDASLTKPIYLQIADAITRMAVAGQLAPQTRLPSSRQLADTLRVHRSTIVNAYDELRARGVLLGLQGSGSYIAEGLVTEVRAERALTPPSQATHDQLLNDIFRLNVADGMISLALGVPGDDMLPLEEFERHRLRVIRREGAHALGYVEPQGYVGLRRAIARHVSQFGIEASAEDVIITNGGQEALSLAIRALSVPGDAALIEQPAFFGMIRAMRHLGVTALGFEQGVHGPDWRSLETRLNSAVSHPRFAFVAPDYNNPTGLYWSASERHRFLRMMSDHDVTVIEDATYIDLRLDGASLPPLRALDPGVVYIGTFSKALFPGIRAGYVIVNADADIHLREQLVTLKMVASGAGESISQRALAEYLTSGDYDEHLERVRRIYRGRRDALLDACARHFPAGVTWSAPSGGYYLWVNVPDDRPVSDLYERALKHGYVIQPARTFYPEDVEGVPNAFRISYSTHAEPVLTRAMIVLGRLLSSPA